MKIKKINQELIHYKPCPTSFNLNFKRPINQTNNKFIIYNDKIEYIERKFTNKIEILQNEINNLKLEFFSQIENLKNDLPLKIKDKSKNKYTSENSKSLLSQATSQKDQYSTSIHKDKIHYKINSLASINIDDDFDYKKYKNYINNKINTNSNKQNKTFISKGLTPNRNFTETKINCLNSNSYTKKIIMETNNNISNISNITNITPSNISKKKSNKNLYRPPSLNADQFYTHFSNLQTDLEGYFNESIATRNTNKNNNKTKIKQHDKSNEIDALIILIKNDITTYEEKVKLIFVCKDTYNTFNINDIKNSCKKCINNNISDINTKFKLLLKNFPSKTSIFQLQFLNTNIENILQNNLENIDHETYNGFFQILSLLLGQINKDNYDYANDIYNKILKKLNIKCLKSLFIKIIFPNIVNMNTKKELYSVENLKLIIKSIEKHKILTNLQDLKSKNYQTLGYFSIILNEIYDLIQKMLILKERKNGLELEKYKIK